jgi:restriction endonuclease S subunit
LQTERLDPYYYQIELRLKSKLRNRVLVPLRAMCMDITDGSRNATEFVDYETNVPYIRLSNIVGNQLFPKEMKYLFDYEGIEGKAIVRKGDILISKIVSLPKVALVNEIYDGAVISPDIIKIRPVDQQSQERLFRFFCSDMGMLSLKKAAIPSIIPKISIKQLGDLAIPIDVNEQKKHSWSEQHDALKRQLNSFYPDESHMANEPLPTELWVESQLFADRLDVEYYRYRASKTFEQLKNKIKNEHWVQIRDICEVVSHTISPADFKNSEIQYIGLKNIDSSRYHITSAEQVVFDKVKSRGRYVVKENDILFGVIGPYIGEENQPVALVNKTYEGAIASSAFAILRNAKYSPVYLLWCLSHPLVCFQLRAKRRGQLQMMLSLNQLAEVYLPVLSPEKMTAIENLVRKLMG